jgi:hypothetical protein
MSEREVYRVEHSGLFAYSATSVSATFELAASRCPSALARLALRVSRRRSADAQDVVCNEWLVWDSSQRSASIAAMQPEPAAVIACR